MSDPNAIYKSGFAELVVKLGRTPTMKDAELLALHETYKKSWGPAEETVLPPKKWQLCPECGFDRDAGGKHRELSPTTSDCERLYPMVSAAGPGDMGFSRQPAPQARTYDSDERAREGQADEEPLSGPGAPEIIPEAVSEPERPPAPESNLQGLAEGDRGPGGGLVSKCVTCGRLWERPATRGRPAYRCVTCRG